MNQSTLSKRSILKVLCHENSAFLATYFQDTILPWGRGGETEPEIVSKKLFFPGEGGVK